MELTDYERSFRRAGLPLLIENYSAREDIFTRALPLLGLLFVLEIFNGINLEWSWIANVAAIVVSIGILMGAVALLNRSHGQPALSIPRRVGTGELVAFCVVPAILPLLGGGQWGSSLATLLGNALTLLLVYWIVGYGVLSILRWSFGRLLGQLAGSVTMLAKAVPLLLFFAVVLFVNTEMWQVFAGVSDGDLAGVSALFVALGTLFIAGRLPREVRLLEREVGTEPALTRRQRFNVGLVMFVAHALQVLVVAAAIGAFFVAFGVLTITPDVVESWTGTTGEEVVAFDLFGDRTVITVELLRVCAAIASFSGLYYAIAVLTDSTYREEFLGEVEESMRGTFRLRAQYLAAREGVGLGA
ncbi:hypothetical protein [Capillimicrobium parvum]|uniref:Integral membrane protein n=1 Tax=Capillimicrobium parvum TaxID=2884022 RepID=A0A9E6XVL9_9ACTN|nr:hypothetical protein [Capillimicrobium parvum]UGS35020.1 hypothetical protein DSM104329_01404 [Capillimicrobium parvum]